MSHDASGNETSTTWTLDLDLHEATENAEGFIETLNKIGEVEGIEQLISTMTHAGLVIGTLGAGMYALKETVDLVFDAEKIRMVEQQFDVLSEKAGVVGESLKKSMVAAADGLMSEDEILQSANRGLVELGANAQRMGDLMQLARQATLIMGGDLKNNFDSIVHAIAAGSTRALRNMGIMIDQKQAFKDYAASIGVAASELSKAGQQHAILNAVLAQGADQFKGVNPSVMEATNAWESFKSTLKDIGDIATLAYEKIAGPAVRAEMGGVSAIAKDAKRWFTDMFGAGAEQAAAHTERLKEKVQDLKGQLIDLEQKKLGHVFDPTPGDTQSKFAALSAQLKKYEAELGQTSAVERKLAADEAAAEGDKEKKVTQNHEVNLELRRKNILKFQTEVNTMRLKLLEDEKKTATSEVQVERVNVQIKSQLRAQEILEKRKIDQQEGISIRQKALLKTQIEEGTRQKLKAIDMAETKDKLQSLKNLEEQNRYTAAGFVDAWAAAGAAAKDNIRDFADLGEQSMKSLSGAMTDAFKAMGDGSKDAGKAMLGAILGALGQLAISKGSVVIASGIADSVMLDPKGPLEIAAGGALVALGGALEAAAGTSGGGGASTPSGGGGGGAGATSGGGGGGSSAPSSPTNLQQTPQKTVSLTIAGNYYDSQDTRKQVMQMVRDATDATDFNYVKVGGK